jgi:fermentation-respiration switch protein FrsA (DUF1100 family)
VIIESGFAHTAPLMERLGISLVRLGISEEEGLGNIHKIGRYDGPALIIHAEHDHIIPFSEGQALYDACPSTGKRLLVIPGANHNDILFRGFREYMEAVRGFVETLGE